MGFAAGFNAGWSSVFQAMKEREAREQREELAAIAKANPEQSQGYTADQGKDLAAAAARGDKVDIAYKDDGQGNQVFDRYVVTPKQGNAANDFMPQSRDVAMQGVTDFLGKRTAGDMSESQADRARMTAMTGVISKTDPVRALAMRQSMNQEDRQAELDKRQGEVFDRQKTQWGREDDKYKREEDDFQLMKGINADVADFSQKLFTLPDGSARQPTPTDNLAINQYRTVKLFAAGKVTEASALAKDNMAMARDAIGLQTEERKAAIPMVVAAIKTGNFEPVKSFYEKYLPDGAKITNISAGKDGKITVDRESIDGVKLPPQVVGSAQELSDGILQTASPEMAFNISQNLFNRDLQLRADNRGDAQLVLSQNADKRAQDSANQSAAEKREAKQEKKQQADAAVALYAETNPGATPAQLNAVKSGVLAAVPKDSSYKVEMGDVTAAFGEPAYNKDGTPLVDPLTGRQVVNRDVAEEKKFFEWMRENKITDTNKGLALYKGKSTQSPKALQNVTDADIKATAKKYNITEDEVRKQLRLNK